MAKKQAQGRSVKERAQDDLVMSTNSSSIVSKRSVERIYYPDEPHFFRFFVKKFQRRSPLINRGYHLRLHVIDVAVRNFLQRPSTKRKVVINLGAGFDVLPWQCLTRYSASSENAKFIDIDFPDLMHKKSRVIQETQELKSALTNMRVSEDPLVLLESDQYVQMGCDLRDLDSIQQSLSKLVDVNESEFIFVAEVSITYMETAAADAVIRWAASLGQTEFCLLEQILPDGADHPFAETMLRHFEKLNTPLRSVSTYPTLQDQKYRFAHLGWADVDVETLWSTWSSEKYLSLEERRKLNEIEPFDEWEEFAIFGAHYCVVSARNLPAGDHSELEHTSTSCSRDDAPPQLNLEATFSEGVRTCQRRFGASMMLEDLLGRQFVANLFGLGNTSRLRSIDIYSSGSMIDIGLKPVGPPARMGHTIVDVGVHGNLLIGGRGSPSAPLKDCWRFDKARQDWQKVEDLPTPLYRHAAVRVGRSSLALVVGGKTGPSNVYNGCLLYIPRKGWVECEISGQRQVPVFGAMLASTTSSPSGSSATFEGILAGGLTRGGTLAKQTLRWELSVSDIDRPIIRFTPLALDVESGRQSSPCLLNRFGANAVVGKNGQLLVIGGIIEGRVLQNHDEVLLVEITRDSLSIVYTAGINSQTMPRPLLLGMSIAQSADGRILLTGGGATCFSMGTYWNKGHYILECNRLGGQQPIQGTGSSSSNWKFCQTLELTDTPAHQPSTIASGHAEKPALKAIPRVRLESPSAFIEILKAGKPVIIERADLGTCVNSWTTDHLVSQVGKDRRVVVHEAATSKLDFTSKNFSYVTKGFGMFVEEVARGGKMYLRALSEASPTDKPAVLSQDFPALAQEFVLPPELAFVAENIFSSVLRITGPVNMWLHYDASPTLHELGSKRLILFPPSDVTELPFAPGASSSSLDVFAELDSVSLANTHPHEALLGPGDVLFLPPLWLHTAAPMSDLGVAVNVFFRNLESGYSAGRDVYGNRDLAAYEKGRQDVTRIFNAFSKVPEDMRGFYTRRLAGELLQKLHE
ncbi:leucine carboxyl methyltransferase [Seiridium cupressi]